MKVTLNFEIEKELCDRATENLAKSGFTLDQAVNLLMVHAASGHVLEFGPLLPNQATIDAINAARNGDLREFGSLEEAIAELTKET